MRDLRLFLISLLIACVVWAMHTFSLEYSATLPCSVRVETNLEGYAPTSTARETMLLRGRATGFYLLKTRGSGQRAVPLEIHVDPRHFKPVEGEEDVFSLGATEIRERLDEQLGDRFVIDFTETEQLTFPFVRESYAKVPVVASLDLTFRPQYMQVGEVRLRPDSVLVYGPVKELERLTEVRTRNISYHSVDKNLQGSVGLEPAPGLRLNLDQVAYDIEVDRYVETTFTLPVTAIHVPEGRSLMILPSQVEFTFRAPFRPRGGRITADDLSLVVDYLEFAGAGSTRVIPKLVTERDVYSWRIKPALVECLQVEK